MRSRGRGRTGVVILVQNLPARRDRRVWSQAEGLRDCGYEVTVVGPAGSEGAGHHVVEGIHVYAYPAMPDTGGVIGYALETGWAMVATALLLVRVLLARPVHALQACNPPDTYALLAFPLRWLGIPFVFDHHDLAVELYEVRYGRTSGMAHRLLAAAERFTYRVADHVIVTNTSYRDLTSRRHHPDPSTVTVVRNGPDPARMAPGQPQPELRHGRTHLCCYLGMMGPQDHVDIALRAMAELVHGMGRADVHLALLGDGPCRDDLERLADELDLDDHVTFTGFADDDMIRAHLSTAAVGLSPEPANPYTHASTMIKVAEYMAFGVPVVAFDLLETRRTAGPAGVFAVADDPASLAKLVADLLDDPDRRAEMGGVGRRRVIDELGWPHQRRAYLGVYEELLRR